MRRDFFSIDFANLIVWLNLYNHTRSAVDIKDLSNWQGHKLDKAKCLLSVTYLATAFGYTYSGPVTVEASDEDAFYSFPL